MHYAVGKVSGNGKRAKPVRLAVNVNFAAIYSADNKLALAACGGPHGPEAVNLPEVELDAVVTLDAATLTSISKLGVNVSGLSTPAILRHIVDVIGQQIQPGFDCGNLRVSG